MLKNNNNRSDYSWLNDISLNTLSRGYVLPKKDENYKDTVIGRINDIVNNAESILNISLPTIRKGLKRGWVSFSSPVWANFGNDRGLPASCNGSYMDDNMESIIQSNAEIGMMTKVGAGTSCYMSKIRHKGSDISTGGKSQGPVHFAQLIQETIQVISQSNVRRGSCAIWLDIEHPDIDDWLMMRSITDGIHHSIQHLSFGVCISDQWMEDMLKEEKGGEKRLRMVKIINRRRASGYPYIFFTDIANERRGDKIYCSNLCTEIMIPSDDDHSFVCVLSSVNALYFDEWKDTDLVSEMKLFLQAVNIEYINKAKKITFMDRAVRGAEKYKAIGLGILGYHSYLQSKLIPFESEEAREKNIEIHKKLSETNKYYQKYYGDYHYTTAIAPTTTSSIILGQVSPAIEPWESNYFENDNAKGVFTQKNKILEELLEKKGFNTKEIWNSILINGGSVQHLDCLTDNEKKVFKTFIEIDQHEIIKQAGDRQKYIDQGQSINLKIHSDKDKKYNVDIIVSAWKNGLKSLYYHKGVNAAQELARKNRCESCEA